MSDRETRTPSPCRRVRAAATVLATLATVAALVTLLGSNRDGLLRPVERSVPASVLLLGTVGVASIVAASWVAAAHHPYVSIGLSLVGFGTLLPVWAGWQSLPAGVRADVLALTPLAVGGGAQIGARWLPSDDGSPRLRIVWVLITLAIAIHVGGYDPFADLSCSLTCQPNVPIAGALLSTRDTVIVSAVITIGAALLAIDEVLRARRRTPRPVILGAVIGLALLASASVVRWSTVDNVLQLETLMIALLASALLILGSSVIAVEVRTRRVRRAVDRLVSGLSAPTGVRPDLTGAIRGVIFAVPGEDRWVDIDGHDIGGGRPDEETMEMLDRSGPVLRLLMAPNQRDVVAIADLSAAVRLALRNTQLAAVAKARVLDVQTSRRRVVAASDAERRRIERDLHDGAQQRLVSASFHLSVARSRLPDAATELTRAEAAVRDVLANLRTLAHGIFPAVLSAEGLRAALEDLVATTDLPTRLVIDGTDDPVPLETSMAAYAAAVAALDAARQSSATSALVSVDRRDNVIDLRIEAAFDGVLPRHDRLIDVADRVGAIGGAMDTSATDRTITVRALLPCG